MAEENKEAKATINVEKQEKLKNKTEVENKDEALKEQTPEHLRQKLSNKNQDYVFRLQKELESLKVAPDEATAKINELLPDIVVAQHHGLPANTLYQMSPKIKAADMLKPKKRTAADIPFWQMSVDGALLYIAIFVGIFGIIALFQSSKQNNNSQMGILTLISVGGIMGAFMTKYNEWVVPNASGAKRKIPWAKLIFGMIGALLFLFVWIWLLALPGIRVINPILPGIWDILIAVAVYGIRWLFRKHYQIVGSVFTPAPKDK